MTRPTPPPPSSRSTPRERTISCPICMDRCAWKDDELFKYNRDLGVYEPISLGELPAVRRRDIRSRSFVRCSSTSLPGSHYLPAVYGDFPDPVVIGLVGRPRSGKSHLLAAMINELINGRASQYGVTASIADHVRHGDYQLHQLGPFARGERLPASPDGTLGVAEWLLIGNGENLRPVVFFDVAGEDFRNLEDDPLNARFLLGAAGLLFVEDTAHVVPESAEQTDIENLSVTGEGTNNPWLGRALERLRLTRGNDVADLPVAVVLSKADRLRYLPPVDRWIRDTDARLRPDRVLAETRDVFALFDQYGADQLTELYQTFRRCTMHVVSATGVGAEDKQFPRGVRPTRVLRPLLTLLTTIGVVNLDGRTGSGG